MLNIIINNIKENKSARDLYYELLKVEDSIERELILKALDEGSNEDIQNALLKYYVKYVPTIDQNIIKLILEKQYV